MHALPLLAFLRLGWAVRGPCAWAGCRRPSQAMGMLCCWSSWFTIRGCSCCCNIESGPGLCLARVPCLLLDRCPRRHSGSSTSDRATARHTASPHPERLQRLAVWRPRGRPHLRTRRGIARAHNQLGRAFTRSRLLLPSPYRPTCNAGGSWPSSSTLCCFSSSKSQIMRCALAMLSCSKEDGFAVCGFFVRTTSGTTHHNIIEAHIQVIARRRGSGKRLGQPRSLLVHCHTLKPSMFTLYAQERGNGGYECSLSAASLAKNANSPQRRALVRRRQGGRRGHVSLVATSHLLHT